MNNFFMGAALCLILPMLSEPTYAIGDGARAYWPVPVGTNIMTSIWVGVDANRGIDGALISTNASFDTDVFAQMYTHTIDVAGHIGAIAIIPSVGRVKGGISGTAFIGESKGFADLSALVLVNLYGVAAMTRKEFQTFTPETAVDLLLYVTAATGKYDSDKTINLGSNRWSLRVGAPILHFFDWGPGNTTSLEFVPSITFYTDNNDPSGAENKTAQHPLFTVEGHLTHDFSKMFWGSLDGFYTAGGETSIDSVDQGNSQRSLGLGGTLGVYFSPTVNMSLTYGEIVSRNDHGMDGNVLRTMLTFVF